MALMKVSFNPETMMCDIDQKQCDAIHQLSDKLDIYLSGKAYDKNKLLNTISEYLPCWYCKKTIQNEVQNLSNVRLGKHERRILLLAPAPESDSEIIEPGEPGLRAYESHLRAIRKLEKFGFLWKSRKKRRRVAVRLSPLGYAITKRLNKELQKRNPIRWAKFKNDLITEASLSNEELLAKFESKIRYDKLLSALTGTVANNSLITALPDLVVQINKDGTMMDFKPAKDWSPNIELGDFIGKNMTEVIPKDIAYQAMNYVEQTLKTGELKLFEYQLPFNDEVRDYEARIVKNHENDVLIFVRDISDKKRSEEKLFNYTNALEQYTANLIQGNYELRRSEELIHKRELLLKSYLDNPNDPVFLINKEGCILTLNEIACQFINKEEKDMVNSSIHALFKPNTISNLKKYIEDVIEHGKFAFFEDRYHEKQYIFSLIPVFDTTGEVNRAAICVREIAGNDISKDKLINNQPVQR
jgi:PAS domain-containing protein